MLKYTLIISSGGTVELRDRLFSTFSSYIPKEIRSMKTFQRNRFHLTLAAEDGHPIIPAIMLAFEANGIHPWLKHRVYYTQKELKSVPFFEYMCTSYPFELEGTTSESYGTRHTGGCPCCGLGSVTDGDVLVDKRFIKTTAFGNVSPEYIASEHVKNLIEENGFTGISFKKNVRDWKGRPMPPYYTVQIDPLPPLDPSTWIYRRNLECGHAIMGLCSELRYSEDKLAGAKDFNLTQEQFGEPYIVVSARVRDVFRKHKIPSHYFPVTLLRPGETPPPPPAQELLHLH